MKQTNAVVAEAQQENALAGINSAMRYLPPRKRPMRRASLRRQSPRNNSPVLCKYILAGVRVGHFAVWWMKRHHAGDRVYRLPSGASRRVARIVIPIRPAQPAVLR